ncbi:MAG: YIP1 family protein [Methanobacteriota archaeon]|nr:MAG: YIP1 family protein [Euryarchaeota archaeon]
MSAGSVVYLRSIRCPECGLLASGYMQVSGSGALKSSCSRCGALITLPASASHVAQIPPQPYHTHSRHDLRRSRHAELYSQPKQSPKLDIGNFLRMPFAPTRAFTTLYRSTDLRWAMVLVFVFALVYSALSTVVTTEMHDVLGIERVSASNAMILASLELVVALVSFLIFGLVSSVVASEVFGGRVDKGSTVTLLGYCYPWFVVISTVLLVIFIAGFSGLELDQVEHWSSDELERAIIWGAALLAGAIIGLIWLLTLVGKAIGVSNDVSTGEGAMAAVIGAIVAGLVSFAMGTLMRLPIGLSL